MVHVRVAGRLLASAIALAALVCAGPVVAGSPRSLIPSAGQVARAAAGDHPSSERGIVQSVSPRGLVLKALDGSTVSIAVDARTRVFLDGQAASILAVRPGFVAVVSLRGASGQPALEVEAFTTTSGLSARPFVGVVRSVPAGAVVVTGFDGAQVTLKAESLARVVVDGKPASVGAIRAGFVAVVKRAATGRNEKKGKAKGKEKKASRPSEVSQPSELFAFSPPEQRGARLYDGVITSVSDHAILLQAQNAGTLTVTLTAKTAVFADGSPGSIHKIRAGDLVVVRTGPRLEIWAFSVP
jgi:hypothetical protein